MEATAAAPKTASATLWSARAIGALVVLFLVFDAVGKLVRPAPVVDAFVRQGMPISLAPVIAILLLALVALYAIPRTSILGAVLLTGYLGGAVSVNLRAASPAFEVLFPVMFGWLVWTPLYIVNDRLRALLPFTAK